MNVKDKTVKSKKQEGSFSQFWMKSKNYSSNMEENNLKLSKEERMKFMYNSMPNDMQVKIVIDNNVGVNTLLVTSTKESLKTKAKNWLKYS